MKKDNPVESAAKILASLLVLAGGLQVLWDGDTATAAWLTALACFIVVVWR